MKTRTIYTTCDGKEFYNKKLAEEHEREVVFLDKITTEGFIIEECAYTDIMNECLFVPNDKIIVYLKNGNNEIFRKTYLIVKVPYQHPEGYYRDINSNSFCMLVDMDDGICRENLFQDNIYPYREEGLSLSNIIARIERVYHYGKYGNMSCSVEVVKVMKIKGEE